MRPRALGMGLVLAFVPWVVPSGRMRIVRASWVARVHVAPRPRAVAPSDGQPVARPLPPRTATRATMHLATRGLCGAEGRPDDEGHFLSHTDLATSVVDGSDLLARVNRSAAGSIAPDFAPDDLVDLRTGAPATADECEPPGGQCLRREAAGALAELFASMRAAGHEPHVHSAFRAYAAQCGVFDKWAYRDGRGFCSAAEQSALAGHSQHQLGTALDLFTRAWADEGAVLRPGFGCSPGGRWLAEHAWEHGFALSYPIAPDHRSHVDACWERTDIEVGVDPRTGYRYEPWHYRYVGREVAARFHAAWLASGPGSSGEITLDQWLRREAGLAGDIDLPVCDGCNCGACTTLDAHGEGPCREQALRLGSDGRPVFPRVRPAIVEVRMARRADGAITLEARVEVPTGTVTQTPVLGLNVRMDPSTGFDAWVPVPRGVAHRYDDLAGAWRLAAEPAGSARTPWPWRTGLADPNVASAWNGANVYLPAMSGARWVRMLVHPSAETNSLRVALVREGIPYDVVESDLPPLRPE